MADVSDDSNDLQKLLQSGELARRLEEAGART
jgi:hypothetical protein